MAQIRLLIADDNASVRGQLRLLLGMGEDREVVGEEEDRWEAPDGEEAILSSYVIGPHSSPTGCGKFPSGQNPPIFPQNITSSTACRTSGALESLLPTQIGLSVQRTPPLAPGDLMPWSGPQDVAPLPAYSTRSSVFTRTHMQGKRKPFSALWGFGVPGGAEESGGQNLPCTLLYWMSRELSAGSSGHDSCNNNKWRMLPGICWWKRFTSWQGRLLGALNSSVERPKEVGGVNNGIEEGGIEYVTPQGRCGGSEGDQARNTFLLGTFLIHTKRETKENQLLPARLLGGEAWKTAHKC